MSESPFIAPTMQAYESVYTGSEVSQKGMELSGSKAKSSAYEAAGILPGVQVESADASGLAAEQNSFRLRGVRGSMGALTVEGMPNYGGNPIGPRDYLYDMENMERLSLYKGAIPGDIGTGVGSRGGAMTLHPKWAQESLGASLSQSVGSHHFTRTYGRFDSGALGEIGTRFSASFSYAKADKWKGEGELGARKNLNLTLVQPLGERGNLKLWLNRNDQENHAYRPLSYAQTERLKENYSFDYHSNKRGNPAQDIHYYDYNRAHYQNSDYLAVLDYRLNDALKLTLKPYYNDEDSEIFQGRAGGMPLVQKRRRDIERYGVMSELGAEWGALKSVLGYHYENSEMNIHVQNYAIAGDSLAYRGYGIFSAAPAAKLHSPYVKFATQGEWGRFQAGLKYFRFEEASAKGYVSDPKNGFALTRAKDLDREARVYDIWLPTLGFSRDLGDSWQVYASYGKSFMRPYAYLPLMNTYRQNRAAFQKAGVKLEDMFDGYKLEESDNFDLGARYKGEVFEVAPTLFFSQHKNLLATISDYRVLGGNGKPLSYQQNVAKARSMGIELEANAFIGEHWTLFFNPTYTRFVYEEDLSFQGVKRATKGKQIVDTPRFMFKSGAIYAFEGWEIAPMVRYLGERYGDSLHAERIKAHWLVDWRVSYVKPRFYGDSTLRVGLEVNNLFNKRYIATIDSFDDARSGNASYYAGAPGSVMFNLSLGF